MKEEKLKRLLKEFADLDAEDRAEIVLMLKAGDLISCLSDIANDIFRPARKHGYPDKEIEEMIEKCGYSNEENEFERSSYGCELISLLETKFFDICKQNDVIDLM